jgi:alginate O-acetyltransferase complex protein AlgI
VGFVKKRCVSETVAPMVKEFFDLPWKYNSYSAWVAVLFFAIQIYCDFSGYSDMAIACARLLGYELTINFNFPYFSKNVPEFWTRWHISLSTWLRDYLYIPLGGNRGTKLFTYRNLMLTMLIGGLWHGASWTFVIWGGMHGFALIVQREWQRLTVNASANVHRFIAWAAAPITFYWVCLTWIFFRAQDSVKELKDGKFLLQGTAFQVATCTLDMFVCFRGGDRGPKARSFGLACIPFIVGLAIIHWLCSRKVFATWWRNLPDWAYSAILGGAMALVLFFSPAKYSNFIYFKF